ncbi:MAG: hypothetical protein KKC19_02530 [Nanoarchaeota archaeon]|nr:hypothetical protein [Nanoarchaeota archaeon]
MKRNLPKESARSILPGKKVFVGRTLYFIHGLVHGNPWIEINPSFKKEIKEQLLGHNILCEDGFAEWIPHAVSLDEAGYFSFQRLPFFDNIYFLGSIVYSHLSKKNKKRE